MDNQDKNKWKSFLPPGVNSVNHPVSTMKREIYVKPFKNRTGNWISKRNKTSFETRHSRKIIWGHSHAAPYLRSHATSGTVRFNGQGTGC